MKTIDERTFADLADAERHLVAIIENYTSRDGDRVKPKVLSGDVRSALSEEAIAGALSRLSHRGLIELEQGSVIRRMWSIR